MKTKAFSITIISLLIAIVAIASDFKSPDKGNQGIDFVNNTWAEILEMAQQENKLIFLDIYASWCGPCKRMKSVTFSDSEVGSLYNQHFINIALDGEKGEGAKLAKKYNVRGYPTLLFIDHEGNLVARTAGYHAPEQFISLAEKVLEL